MIHPLQILSGLDPVQSEDPLKKAGTLEALKNTLGQGLIQEQQITAGNDAAKTRQAAAAADQDVVRILQNAKFDADGNLDPQSEQALTKNGSTHAQAILTNISTVAGRKSNIQRDRDLTQHSADTLAQTIANNEADNKRADDTPLSTTPIETEEGQFYAYRNPAGGDPILKRVGGPKPKAAPAAKSLQDVTIEDPKNPGKGVKAVFDPSTGITTVNGAKVDNPRAYRAPAGELITVQTTNNEGAPVTKVVRREEGAEFDAQPTSTQRDQSAQLKKISPVLDKMAVLSEKINTGKGLEAKARGEVEKLKAKANYNDDVAEYEALVSGFTPMVARAVGHTGVLTQQDVDSVRALFPKPGDSKTLRDRKMAQIKSLIDDVRSMTPGSGSENTPVPTADGWAVKVVK